MSPLPSAVPLSEVAARMRPGRYSEAGFLGADEVLEDVLARDSQSLAEIGVAAGDLAHRLAARLEPFLAGRRRWGLEGRWWVRVRRHKGYQACPFRADPEAPVCERTEGVHFASIDWRIRNLVRWRGIAGPGLIVHLIAAHGFFEGRDSPYRVDPLALARVLELGRFARKERPDTPS